MIIEYMLYIVYSKLVGISKRDSYGACEPYGRKSLDRILGNLIKEDWMDAN
ncbi:MAG: hypothetical protein ABSB40_01565 [Nitrososphaeria archaeon]|jgi:hypothetical protein